MKEITRSKILKVAEKEFASTNFKATTLKIAKEAGVAHGTLFFHFKNREGLIYDVVKIFLDNFTDSVYENYKYSIDLDDFLTKHLNILKDNWSFMSALMQNFSQFNKNVIFHITSAFAVVNYYFNEIFGLYSDNAYLKTFLCQGFLLYSIFFNQLMKDQNIIDDNFYEKLKFFLNPEKIEVKKKILCLSCAMIISKEKDLHKLEKYNNLCMYCRDKNGNIKPFQDVLNEMMSFLKSSQGLCNELALQASISALSKNTQWKNILKDNIEALDNK